MPDGGLVDWTLAERVAGALTGSGPAWDGSEAELRVESDRAAKLVRRYTGLRPKGGVTAAELVDRGEALQRLPGVARRSTRRDRVLGLEHAAQRLAA